MTSHRVTGRLQATVACRKYKSDLCRLFLCHHHHSDTHHRNFNQYPPSPTLTHHPQWPPSAVSAPLFTSSMAVLSSITQSLHVLMKTQHHVAIANDVHQTSLPSSPLPSLSARPSTTLSPSPSLDPSSVTHTAARSKLTPRRSTSTPRRPLPLPHRGVALSSALVSRPTVSVL